MVNFQNSIWECLHHHILSKMFFDGILKEHCSQILSCSSFKVGIWLIARPILPTFQLSSPIFFIVLRMWLGLSHSSIVGLPWCVCTHLIHLSGIHLLCCAHSNERTWTPDVVHDTFVTIVQNANFHVCQEQLHALPSLTFNSSYRWVNILFTKDGILILTDVIIVDSMNVNLLS